MKNPVRCKYIFLTIRIFFISVDRNYSACDLVNLSTFLPILVKIWCKRLVDGQNNNVHRLAFGQAYANFLPDLLQTVDMSISNF